MRRTSRSTIPSQTNSRRGHVGRGGWDGEVVPLRLVEQNSTEPLPADEAAASACPVPANGVLFVLAGGLAAAEAAAVLAERDGAEALLEPRAAAAMLGPAGRVAESSIAARQRERDEAIAHRSLVLAFLGGRLHRTRLTRTKAGILTGSIVGGEVMLNSGAAIYAGDVVILAVLSFLGIGAATAGVGWLGAVIRRGVDLLAHPEQAPPAAVEAGLSHFYGSHRRGTILVAAGIVGLVAGALGLAIAALRVAAGSYALYGVFTAVTVVGAAAVAYCAEDAVADLLDALGAYIERLETELVVPTEVAGRWRAARATYRQVAAAWAHEPAAQFSLVAAATYYGLSRQVHVVGHYVNEKMIPLTRKNYRDGSWKRHDGIQPGGESTATIRLLRSDPSGGRSMPERMAGDTDGATAGAEDLDQTTDGDRGDKR